MHSLRPWNRLITLRRIRSCDIQTKVFLERVNTLTVIHRSNAKKYSGILVPSSSVNYRKTFCTERNIQSSGIVSEHATSINKSRNEMLMLRLESDIDSLKRVYRSDIEHLLHDWEAEGVKCDKKVGVLLLQCCGSLLPDQDPSSRVQLAHIIWETLISLGTVFSVEHYNALLQSYIANKHGIVCKEFLSRMDSVEPNETTFKLLLACVCEAGDIDQASDMISQMKEKGFPASEATFNALILGHARAGDLINARGVVNTMRAAHLAPSIDTYVALLKGYAEVGDMQNLCKTFQDAGISNVQMNETHLLDVIKSLATHGHQQLVTEMLQLVPEGSIDMTPAVTNMAINLVHSGCELTAYYLLRAVPADSGFVPEEDSVTFGAVIIHEMVKANRPASSIIEICDMLVADGRNSYALHKATEMALRRVRADLALVLLKALKERCAPLRAHYFWPLFLAAGKQNREAGVFTMLQHMQELDVPVDFDTLVDYILPHSSLADPQALLRKLQAQGLPVSNVLTPIVLILLRGRQMKTALQLCNNYKVQVEPSRLLQPLVKSYIETNDLASAVGLLCAMISSNSKQGTDWAGQFMLEVLTSDKKRTGTKDIRNIIKAFQMKNIYISPFAGEIIAHHVSRFSFKQTEKDEIQLALEGITAPELSISSAELSSQHIPHPRDMDLEELECHLVELKAKNLNTRGVLRRLLQLYCRRGNVEKAMDIKKELVAAGYEFSAGMQASLFDLHVQLGHLNEAETHLTELSKTAPSFMFDDHKIIDFATLLVTNNRYRGAVSILEKQAGSQKVKGGNAVVRNCWKLLQAVAEKGDPQFVKHMLEILQTYGFCEVSNVVLGPVIRAHLIQGSLLGAVKEYKLCVSQFRKTPLQHELLCRLVDEVDSGREDATTMLQEVLDATQTVHGAASVQVALAIALAETGKTKQLQKLLMDPGVNLRESILIPRCKRLADQDKLTALKLLAGAGGAKQNINSSAIYMIIMQAYSQRGDCNGALSLWTSMQDLDIHPSEAFLTTLAALLKRHNRDVPFAVPREESQSIN